jgi:hypothetical protein
MFGYALPFTHTGVRLNLPVNDKLNLQASLVNGWEVVNDNNRFKTLGLSGSYVFPSNTVFALTVYSGPEGDTAAVWRTLVDAIITQPIGDKLTLMLNGDYAFEGPVSWYGAAFSARYAFNPSWRVAGRVEYFNDSDAQRGIGTEVGEATLTVSHLIYDHAEVRAEVRHDLARDPIFLGATQSAQTTAQLALMAWF